LTDETKLWHLCFTIGLPYFQNYNHAIAFGLVCCSFKNRLFALLSTVTTSFGNRASYRVFRLFGLQIYGPHCQHIIVSRTHVEGINELEVTERSKDQCPDPTLIL